MATCHEGKYTTMTNISAVLLLVMVVRCGRWLAARWGGLVTVTSYQPDDELPADYGMNPQRPWGRHPRQRARLSWPSAG
jgi:hypothetical protein